ncbi:hypothetical protein ACFC9N_12325 [Enterococcus casseliflavus]|uniref:hypothetical protein n=1 Tax=Enterococcus casseliflavus TaxID=37734 RepID=UPI0039A63621
MKIVHGEYYKDEDYYKKCFYKAIAEHDLPEGYQSKRENEFLENHRYFLVADLTQRDLRKMINVAYLDVSKLELIPVTKEERKIHSSITKILEYQARNKFTKIDDKELSSDPLEVVHWGYYKKRGNNHCVYEIIDIGPLPDEHRDEESEELHKNHFNFFTTNLVETDLTKVMGGGFIDTKTLDLIAATEEEIAVHNAMFLLHNYS